MRAQTFMVGMLGIVLLALVAIPADAQKPAGVIDTVDAEWSGVQTDLLEVRRMSDNTLRVRWRWRNTGDKEAYAGGSDAASLLREETYLLDPVNKKKHFVVTDAKGKPIATDFRNSFRLKAKEAFSAWAKFPAPPASMEKITVVIAKTPPFEDVAITK